MDTVLTQAFLAAQKGRSFAFATIVEATGKGTPRKSGAKMVVMADGSSFGTIGGGRHEKTAIEECLKAIKTLSSKLISCDSSGKNERTICGGKFKVFIEPIAGHRTFIQCGAGHIGLPLSVMAKMLGFKIVVIDNRREFANKKRFPHADKIMVGQQAKKLSSVKIQANSAIMIATQDHIFDYGCLKSALKSPAGYIGLIASKVKRSKFFARLLRDGFSKKDLIRIKSPAGIDIGAQTPEEIAVSVSAEIIKHNNHHWLKTEKFQSK